MFNFLQIISKFREINDENGSSKIRKNDIIWYHLKMASYDIIWKWHHMISSEIVWYQRFNHCKHRALKHNSKYDHCHLTENKFTLSMIDHLKDHGYLTEIFRLNYYSLLYKRLRHIYRLIHRKTKKNDQNHKHFKIIFT